MSENAPQHTTELRIPATGKLVTLPAQLTRLVGREREAAEVERLLSATRLLTLTGAGGSGKTRLAVEVAERVAPGFDGSVGWVELAPLVDPQLIAEHVASALGVRLDGSHPAAEAIVAALRGQPTLLVLDNCEHIVDACARLVEQLLRGCPRLRVLATSREPLGISGEQSWLVPVLAVPEATSNVTAAIVARSPAVQLFIERARDALPGFELTDANASAVARICRRVDGLPLAIELAAARIRMLGPEQVAARLDEGFRLLDGSVRSALPRHRTLRAAIDWSYRLLDDRERLLLARLSVLAGDWSLEAAEHVCGDARVDPADMLDLVGALVDKSLVLVRERGGSARYELLETIRQYAAERLGETGSSATLHERHARFYAALVAAAEPDFVTSRRRAAVEEVARELDNLRAALAWTREHDGALHVRIVGMLTWLWYSLGLWTEGRRWLEGALSSASAAKPTRERAAALFGAGAFASLQADADAARAWLTESLEIARSIGDDRLAAYASNYLAMAYIQRGMSEGDLHAREALAWFRAAGDLYGHRLALLLAATLHLARGELVAALASAEEGVAVARAYGLDRELGISLQVLGGVVLQAGDLDRADSLIRESLRLLRHDPHPLFTGRGLELLGLLSVRRGDPLLGARYFGAAAAEREYIGAGLWRLDHERLAPHVQAARLAAGTAPFDAAWTEGATLGPREAVELALASHQPPGIATPSLPNVTQPAGPAQPLFPDTDARPHAAYPALRVLALGHLEIYRRGELLPADAWRSAKPRELLLYLLCHPAGRTREQVDLVFWPEASAAQVKNNFHVTLHHLRKVLGGADRIVYENDRYLVNEDGGLEFDALVFEREISAALRERNSAPAAGQDPVPERLRSSLAVYRGDLLEDVAVGDWHFELRDRLRRLWAEGMRRAGRLLMAAEQYADAAVVYRSLVQREELHEEGYRLLMTCLSRTGDRAQAMRVYDRLTRLLRSDLDAEPEDDTTALFERLRRAELV